MRVMKTAQGGTVSAAGGRTSMAVETASHTPRTARPRPRRSTLYTPPILFRLLKISFHCFVHVFFFDGGGDGNWNRNGHVSVREPVSVVGRLERSSGDGCDSPGQIASVLYVDQLLAFGKEKEDRARRSALDWLPSMPMMPTWATA
jgi:hypothetical protein